VISIATQTATIQQVILTALIEIALSFTETGRLIFGRELPIAEKISGNIPIPRNNQT
jgi:hypothetical protein